MATFPAIAAYIDWANLVDAPGYSEYVASMSTTLISSGFAVATPWLSYLRLDEPYGATSVDDMGAGTSRTVTNVNLGGSAALGRSAATSAVFRGAGRIPLATFSSATMTVVAMVRPGLLDGGYIVSTGTGGAGIYVDASGHVVLTVPGTGDICTATAALAVDRWAHVVVTYDGTVAHIYIDGADVSGATTVRTVGSGIGATGVIGANQTAGPTYSAYFTGSIAEIGVGYGVMTGREAAYIASLARNPWAETNADMTGLISEPLTIKRGRSADYSSDATGSCSFTLNNAARLYDPMRNWCDNGSMETDLSHWSDEVGLYCSGGTLRRVADTAGYGGRYAGEVDVADRVNSGVACEVEYPVRAGIACSLFVALKSISGQTTYDVLAGSADDASDYALTSVTITGAWAPYTLSWTPRTSGLARIVIRTASPTAGTFRVDALGFSSGTGTTFVEAPTRGQLQPGRSVLLLGTYDTTTAPLFFGEIDSLSPDAASLTVTVSCKDAFANLSRASLAYGSFTGTHRGFRAEVLRRALAGWRNDDRGSWGSWMVTVGTSFTRTRPMLDLPDGEAVRFSGEVRVLSGPGIDAGGLSVRIGAYVSGVAPTYVDVPLGIIGGGWVAFDVAVKTKGGANLVEYGFLSAVAGRTVEIRGTSLLSGAAAHPYVTHGDAGLRAWRHNAAALNPSADAHQGYWVPPPFNRVPNPTFAASTAGWNVTADTRFVVYAGPTLTRTAGGYDDGWCGRIASLGLGMGAWTVVSGAFTAGESYCFTLWARASGSDSSGYIAAYSPVVGGDSATCALTTLTAGVWTRLEAWLTPTVTRADMHLAFIWGLTGGTTVDIDTALCYWSPLPNNYVIAGVSPLCLDASITESTFTRLTTGGHDGRACLQVTSGNAIAFPLQKPGAWPGSDPGAYEVFDGDASSGTVAYTVSAWVRTPSAGATVVLTIGRQSAPGSAASTTVTTISAGWERVTVRWTPPGGSLVTDVWVTVRGVTSMMVASLLITEGRRLWPYMPDFTAGLDESEEAWLVPISTPSGSALGALAALNAANATRHWIDPLASAPWWMYRSRSATTLTEKQVAETYADDISGITGADTSYDTIQNVAQVTPSTRYIIPASPTGGYVGTNTGYTGDVYASDGDSVALHGRSDAGPVSGDFWENIPGDRTVTQAAADRIVARYASARPRPSIVVENRWPSQLVRGPDDLVALDFPRLGLTGAPYLIVSITHDISTTGRYWRTTYQLEEFGAAPVDSSLAGGLPEYAGPEYSLPAGMPM